MTWPSEPPGDAPQWPHQGVTTGGGYLDAKLHQGESPTLLDERRDGPAGPGGGGPEGGMAVRAAWWVLPGLLVGFVLSGIGAAIGQGVTGSSTSGLTDLLGEVGLWTAFLATALWVSRRYGTGSLRRDYGLGVRAVDVLWAVLAVATALAITEVVVAAFQGTKFSGSNDQILTQQKGHEVGLVLVSVLVALGAPFFEELFFRGYFRTALQQRFGTHGAVWIQAALFALLHFGETPKLAGNVSVVLAMLGVGVVLGYTARLTGRLGAGMMAHCLFNLLAVASVV